MESQTDAPDWHSISNTAPGVFHAYLYQCVSLTDRFTQITPSLHQCCLSVLHVRCLIALNDSKCYTDSGIVPVRQYYQNYVLHVEAE